MREVALLNPAMVTRITAENIRHTHTFVFAKVEDLFSFCVIRYASCKVSKAHRASGVIRQFFHSIRQFVFLQLCFQHLVGCHGVCICSMGIGQIFAAVELICRHQVAWFLTLEDGKHIHHAHAFQIDVHAYAQHLLCQQWQIEVIGVVARQIRTLQHFCQFGCYLLKGRAIHQVLVINTMYSTCFVRDMHLNLLSEHGLHWFNAEGLPLGAAIRKDLVVTQFYNSVLSYI